MAYEYKDEYGSFVANNYVRSREHGRSSRNENNCSCTPSQLSTAAHIQRSLFQQPDFYAKYQQGRRQSSLGWGLFEQEKRYLSLDSDSDSESTKSYCSSCGGTIDGSSATTSFTCDCDRSRKPQRSRQKSRGCRYDCEESSDDLTSDGGDRSRHGKKKSTQRSRQKSRGCRYDCEESSDDLTSDGGHRSRYGKKKSKEICPSCCRPVDNVREKVVVANSRDSRKYHRCRTPRAHMPVKCSDDEYPYSTSHFRGVNPELRPGPIGDGLYTEEDVLRKYKHGFQ